VCPSCAAACRPDFAFCPRCGARLRTGGAAPAAQGPGTSAATPEADRRPVTVLFADLAGFTALSERLDPEVVRAIQKELLGELAAAIAHYGGFVEKFAGDAVLAVFGAPVAHEDDAERALRAALAMHERTAALSARWEHRLGQRLALHVGVNTGPVVAGALGVTADTAYTVSGDTVNTAARLQGAAAADETFVSRATCRLTQHAFAFEARPDLRLKGKAQPVPVYRLLRALEAPRPARGLEAHGLAAPLTGRELELAELLRAFEAMLAGRTQVVSLVGEAGAGKSRLQTELLAALAAAGHLRTTAVRRAVCSSLGEETYGVLASLLREAYGIARGDSLDVTRRKLAAGIQALGGDAEPTAWMTAMLGHALGVEVDDRETRHLEPEQLRRQIFLAGRALIERRLGAGPLLLVVEDLHWADAASIEFLRFMVDRLSDRRFMLLLAYRPAAGRQVLDGTRAAHTVIRLEPLPPAASEALLAAFFGGSATRQLEPLLQLVAERAGGNPFYLEEIVRSLIADGVLVRENGAWRCTVATQTLNVPVTVQGLLLSRIDHLPAATRRLLQIAAVIGPEFDAQLLRMVAVEADIEHALGGLVDAELLAPTPRGTDGDRCYRFRHGLVHDAVYENLLLSRRTELHTRIGQALEELGAGRGRRPEELEALGHHWSLSTDRPRGARYLVAAGDWASAVYANADAARHYQRALAALEECEDCDAERLAVRERLADLLVPSGAREAALGHYEAVRAGQGRAGDRVAEARALRKIGGLHWDGGDRTRALDCFRTALALLRDGRDPSELARVYQEIGRLAFRRGDHRHAAEWAEQALAHAQRPPSGATPADRDPQAVAAAVAHARNTLGVALARLGQLGEAVAHIEESVAVASAHELLAPACRGLANLGVLYSTLDPRRAIETCARGLETAKRIGDLGLQSRLYANLAVAYCALTNRCDREGIDAAQAAIDLDRRLGQLDHLAVPLIVLGQIYQCHGEPGRALAHYREALALAEATGEPQLLFPCYDGLATVYLELGDEPQAERYMRSAQAVCERAGLEPEALVVLPFLD
jgi:adenylate cyclase